MTGNNPIRTLFNYSDRANDQLIEASSGLIDDQLDRAIQMGRGQHRVLGQPLDPALCIERLLAPGPGHGTADDHRRPARLARGRPRFEEEPSARRALSDKESLQPSVSSSSDSSSS